MKKDIVLVFALILLVVILVQGVEIQSVEEYYMTHADDITEDSETVYLTIRCDTILDNYDKLETGLRSDKYVPKDGMILEKKEYVLRPGDTVFDILKRATRQNRIQLEYQGQEANQYGTVYIQGINNIYEFSCGELSGWMYTVNQQFPDKGASAYELKDQDSIEWVYSCDLGRDIGVDRKGGNNNWNKTE